MSFYFIMCHCEKGLLMFFIFTKTIYLFCQIMRKDFLFSISASQPPFVIDFQEMYNPIYHHLPEIKSKNVE